MTASEDGYVRMWDPLTGQECLKMVNPDGSITQGPVRHHNDAVTDLLVHIDPADGTRYLFTSSDTKDTSLRVLVYWLNTATKAWVPRSQLRQEYDDIVRGLESGVTSMCISAQTLAVALRSGGIRLHGLHFNAPPDGEVLPHLCKLQVDGSITSLCAFGDDRIVAPGDDGMMRVWQWKTNVRACAGCIQRFGRTAGPLGQGWTVKDAGQKCMVCGRMY